MKEIIYSDLPLLNQDLFENIHQLIAYGADKIELMMDGDKWGKMEELFAGLAPRLREIPVEFTIHPPAWDINLTSENKAIREASFHEYKKAIEFAGMIGASHVVIHPGFCFSPVFDKKLAQKRALEGIHRLCEVAKPLNVRLAIENVGYNGSGLYTAEEYAQLLDGVDETAGYLIDIGHAQLDGWDVPKVIESVKERLIALHLHDNMGESDDHLPIGEGIMDFKKVLAVVNQHKIDCELILEYAPGTPLDKLQVGKELIKREVLVY
ncbi:sugar phosphate isomerase/epimerase family protein [Bacillus sp. B15-48]|uniref:sugar phosphate isomerase/epimerase family protein n=1 Tax=Bacillus sp. B15-48 TaxID=1548601 RepID=UPI00193EFDAB|nr:sugar phosphate isomerase/epimerase family protein [Bacillus sp. B15-48]MBM4761148.1 TIM barrel protein [Bacillus sp. B15-48]